MTLGALLDLGVPKKFFLNELKKIPLSGYKIEIINVEVNHIAAVDVNIIVTEVQHHRSLADITKIIQRSRLSSSVKERSKKIFENLAWAEHRIHKIPLQQIHFHEVGAVDSILDIVGSVIGLSYLSVEKIYCSPLPLGHGFVSCEHGILPLPAPATMELLKGIPVYSVKRTQELVTPTGAAIVKTLADHFGELPPMKITRIGYGSGKIKSEYPNILRIYLGELENKQKKRKKESR